ncbi:hypothetical protein E34_1988 [Lactococcus lactis subsp. lactis]|nr:hypothetical protein E34_1988 [Lactococcus lactis subsp. lactis]
MSTLFFTMFSGVSWFFYKKNTDRISVSNFHPGLRIRTCCIITYLVKK